MFVLCPWDRPRFSDWLLGQLLCHEVSMWPSDVFCGCGPASDSSSSRFSFWQWRGALKEQPCVAQGTTEIENKKKKTGKLNCEQLRVLIRLAVRMQRLFCGALLWKLNSCGGWCDDSRSLGCVLLLLLEKKTSRVVAFGLLTLGASGYIHIWKCQMASRVDGLTEPPTPPQSPQSPPVPPWLLVPHSSCCRRFSSSTLRFLSETVLLAIPCLLPVDLTRWFKRWSCAAAVSWFHGDPHHTFMTAQTHTDIAAVANKDPCAASTLWLAAFQLAVFKRTRSLFWLLLQIRRRTLHWLEMSCLKLWRNKWEWAEMPRAVCELLPTTLLMGDNEISSDMCSSLLPFHRTSANPFQFCVLFLPPCETTGFSRKRQIGRAWFPAVTFTSKQRDSPLSYALHFLRIISHQMCCAGERAEGRTEGSLHLSDGNAGAVGAFSGLSGATSFVL